MKFIISAKKLFLLSFFIVIITNIIILGGVISNKTLEPKREIILTERELKIPGYKSNKEDSAVTLKLKWRVLDIDQNKRYIDYSRQPLWLDHMKLKELGVNVENNDIKSDSDTRLYKPSLKKELFIVLENNGKTYKESIKKAQMYLEEKKKRLETNKNDKSLNRNVELAQNELDYELNSKSRLFAIDAGIDAKLLREKYSDQSKFIITKGLIRPLYNKRKKRITGYIEKLSVENIHVSLEHRQDITLSERYKVILAYGSRYEPWIVDVESVE